MSDRACHHFEESQEKELVGNAKALNVIQGFDQHKCSTILKKYVPILARSSVEKFKTKLVIDRGALLNQHSDCERLPEDVDVEDRVLQILILIGERVLESSKIVRQQQSAEFGDVSDSGRKLDMLFTYNGLDISNVEFEKPKTTEQELAIQHRKNIRLARCIQEHHAKLGIEEPSILMADVAGFVGVIYQVKPLKGITVAGETVHTPVSLPRTRATLMAFLEDASLAIMWNYIAHLEAQGRLVSDAKELHESALEKAKMERAKSWRNYSTVDAPQATVQKRFRENVILTPSKRRVKVLTLAELEDSSELSPPPSPSRRSSS
ncbi:hypothetical protein DFQ26_002740 [Actinomortierella ambigua]|nr:hypothetical protein DFQ26_002740 [Actinomortierella ambigua]